MIVSSSSTARPVLNYFTFNLHFWSYYKQLKWQFDIKIIHKNNLQKIQAYLLNPCRQFKSKTNCSDIKTVNSDVRILTANLEFQHAVVSTNKNTKWFKNIRDWNEISIANNITLDRS